MAKWSVMIGILCAVMLSACNLNAASKTSTPFAVITATPEVIVVTATPPQATDTPEAPTPTATIFLPTATDTPTTLPTTPPPTPTPTAVTGVKIIDLKMMDQKAGWAIGQYVSLNTDDILITADGGLSWKAVTPNEPNRSGKIATAFFLDMQHAWVSFGAPAGGNLAEKFTIWYTTDGGAHWLGNPFSITRVNPLKFNINQIFFLDTKHGWVKGDAGSGSTAGAVVILNTVDGGASWESVSDPQRKNLDQACPKNGLWFRDVLHGLIGDQCGGGLAGLYLFRTDDGGNTWSNLDLPDPSGATTFFNHQEYFCSLDTPKFFDAQHGTVVVSCSDSNKSKTGRWVYRTQNGGGSWTSSPMPRPFGGYFFLDFDHGWYLGQTGLKNFSGVIVYQTSDGGKNWKEASSTQWGGNMDYVDARNGWVVIQSGGGSALVRTYDGGLSYQLLNPSLAP